MQQSATLSNESASQPSPNRPHEPSTRQGARHQIRSNSDIIKSIWEATVLGNLPEPDTGRSIMEPTSNLLLTLSDPPSALGRDSYHYLLLNSWRQFWQRHDLFTAFFLLAVSSTRLNRYPFRMTSVGDGNAACWDWLSFSRIFPTPTSHANGSTKEKVPSIAAERAKARSSDAFAGTRLTVIRGGLRPRYLPVSHFPVKRLESQ